MPQVQQYYDIEDTFGVASRLKKLKMRIEEAENKVNRGKHVRLRNGWIQCEKTRLHHCEFDDVNKLLERPTMPVSKYTRATIEDTARMRNNGSNSS